MVVVEWVVAVVVVIAILLFLAFRPSGWKSVGQTTEVTMKIDGESVPVVFNDTKTAKVVLSKMPFTISFTSSGVDYCGSLGNIEHDESDLHRGWAKGDIVYMTRSGWLSIFTGMQNSVVPGNVTVAHIDRQYMDKVKVWSNKSSIRITFEITV